MTLSYHAPADASIRKGADLLRERGGKVLKYGGQPWYHNAEKALVPKGMRSHERQLL